MAGEVDGDGAMGVQERGLGGPEVGGAGEAGYRYQGRSREVSVVAVVLTGVGVVGGVHFAISVEQRLLRWSESHIDARLTPEPVAR